jgi:AcrR family transcriptional regulator
MRADAVKNRERILLAAAEVFAANGVSVPIDLVAERAGVGVGTLYRHFPTKEALFEAIVATKMADLVAIVRAAGEAENPERALYGFIELMASEAAKKQDLFDALGSAGIDVKSNFADILEQLRAGIERLLSRASAEHAVRDDVNAEDVIGLVIGTCQGMRRMGRDAASTKRLIGILCEGLRPSRSSP